MLFGGGCARERAAQPTPSPNPTPAPLSFAASRIGTKDAPSLSPAQLTAIRAVLAASSATDRPNLIVSFPHGLRPGVRGTIVLVYGDPHHPDGASAEGILSYRVIGGGCNRFYRASEGYMYAAPGEGAAQCNTFRDSAADRAAQRYGLGSE